MDKIDNAEYVKTCIMLVVYGRLLSEEGLGEHRICRHASAERNAGPQNGVRPTQQCRNTALKVKTEEDEDIVAFFTI